MNIRFVPQAEIDRQLYNSCVHFANNGSIYGYDWWLNNTARTWDLLVEGDNYVSAMPLPYVKNWLGQSRLIQPRLVPELALYSVKPLSPKRVQAFWDAIPASYKKGELTLEPWSIPKRQSRFELSEATGSVLDLSRTHEDITADFPPSYYSELAKAELADLVPTGNLKPERIAKLYRDQHGAGTSVDWHFHALQRLMYQVLHRGWGGSWGIQDRNGDVLAAMFLIYSHGRLFPLAKTVTALGSQLGAEALLWENILHAHAGRPLRIKKEELPFLIGQ